MLPPSSLPDLASPCIRNCCLDDNDICLGCGRSLQEITRWSGASDQAKRDILGAASQRRQQRQQVIAAIYQGPTI